MKKTTELIEHALRVKKNKTYWSKKMNANPNAISVALNRGHLSPEMAGELARVLGLDVKYWVAASVVEMIKEPRKRMLMERALMGKEQAGFTTIGMMALTCISTYAFVELKKLILCILC